MSPSLVRRDGKVSLLHSFVDSCVVLTMVDSKAEKPVRQFPVGEIRLDLNFVNFIPFRKFEFL